MKHHDADEFARELLSQIAADIDTASDEDSPLEIVEQAMRKLSNKRTFLIAVVDIYEDRSVYEVEARSAQIARDRVMAGTNSKPASHERRILESYCVGIRDTLTDGLP